MYVIQVIPWLFGEKAKSILLTLSIGKVGGVGKSFSEGNSGNSVPHLLLGV